MYRCKYIPRDMVSILTLFFIFERTFVIEYATRNPLRKKKVSTDNNPDQTDSIMGSEYACISKKTNNSVIRMQ